jgi:hypothetical protein
VSAPGPIPVLECRQCPQTAAWDWMADEHETNNPGHRMTEIHPDRDVRSNPKDRFQCQQCSATTNLVRTAEQHEFNNPDHDMHETDPTENE